MRIFWYLVCLSVAVFATDFDFVKAYRQGGIQAIENAVHKQLMSYDYWLNSLSQNDIRFGYYESVKFVFVADKKESTLKLFDINEAHQLTEKYSNNALMGSKPGDKLVEGDLKTPIGAYDLTTKLTKLDQFYGPLAYVTSYPNLYDRLQNKTGYGIWIHGLPFNGDREINTRGCIAIDNTQLLNIDKEMNIKNAILITGDGNLTEMTKEQAANILSGLFQWRNAWEKNDFETYIAFYDKNQFKRFDKMKFNDFKDYKRRIFSKNESKTIEFKTINISPYPNEKGEQFFRISFYEKYRASGGYRFEGNKELYARLQNNKLQIVAER
ncbi:peptidase [Helicobacter monodelphidis]|uniref:L,D-transpeptidase family protein n=1 Tax=Helicobacter sp. 15-1451 TaxID=2004995 RepID=UPI000DCCBD25|nr:L,D-transpeptidase family protein [Helicobacter sp. 15-1451]RAX58425.1 peptidase [Helicobacter sp. 15-1451]